MFALALTAILEIFVTSDLAIKQVVFILATRIILILIIVTRLVVMEFVAVMRIVRGRTAPFGGQLATQLQLIVTRLIQEI